jgi:hypothetical protein
VRMLNKLAQSRSKYSEEKLIFDISEFL